MKTNQSQKNKTIIFTLVFILGIFFVSKLSYAQTWVQTQDKIKENTQQIQNIESKMTDLKDNYRLLYDGAKNQNDQLGNLISYSGYILAILGLVLAWYINRQYEKIKEMKDIVESTKKYIDGHSEELYEKIKRDETVNLLDRLENVPEDITNIIQLLLSRDLFEEDYIRLKNPYLKIKNDTSQVMAKNSYIILFMQHFPYQTLKDSDLKTDFILSINSHYLSTMFDRDMKNFFDQVFKYLKEFGVSDEQNKTIIKNLFYFYSKSRFQTCIELQKFIKELLVKYKLNNSDISVIAKEQAPADTAYTNWLDSIFT